MPRSLNNGTDLPSKNKKWDVTPSILGKIVAANGNRMLPPETLHNAFHTLMLQHLDDGVSREVKDQAYAAGLEKLEEWRQIMQEFLVDWGPISRRWRSTQEYQNIS
ncbi:unnamed protein product, partial [Mesorhabditis spiculigera]